MDFTALVDTHYRGLYQFAYSLAHSEADAGDLTQETFLRWAQKGSQLRETAKAKSWLFTTLYRLFLNRQRHVTRFPHDEISDVENKLPVIVLLRTTGFPVAPLNWMPMLRLPATRFCVTWVKVKK